MHWKRPNWWPWVSRTEYQRLQQENYTLRDALRSANEELRKHRMLLAGLRAGDQRMTDAVSKVIRSQG